MVSEQQGDFRGSFSGYERDRLFYNPNGSYAPFVQSAYVFGLDADDDGRAVAAVDIDGDGDLDLAQMNVQGLRLYENLSAPRRFARVRLAAARAPAHALGARVRLRAAGAVRQDFVKITEGFRTQVPFDLQFGLDDAATIEWLEVRWPSGNVEVWRNLPVDQLLIVREGAKEVDHRALDRWPDSTRPPGLEAPSPSFVAQPLDAPDIRIPIAAGGRAAVVNFWAPWCAPCNVELPQLVDLSRRYGGEVDFVGVSVELKDIESVRATIAKFGIPYAQSLADEAVMQRFFGGSDQAALPSTFVFDGDGQLRRLFRGAITESDLDGLLASFRDEGVRPADLSLLARLSFQAGQYDKAAEYYRRLADLEPASVEQAGVAWEDRRAQARFGAGVARLRAGRPAEAIAELEAALRLLGEDPAVLLQLGTAALDAGRLNVAAEALDHAIHVEPRAAPAWLAKARVHRARGEIEAARDSYGRTLMLDPSNSPARLELADLETTAPGR